MDEKKDAKPPMPTCRLCGVSAIDMSSYGIGPARIEPSSGCCLACSARRDQFALAIVASRPGPDFTYASMEKLVERARAVYREADAHVIGRAHADLPPEGSEAS